VATNDTAGAVARACILPLEKCHLLPQIARRAVSDDKDLSKPPLHFPKAVAQMKNDGRIGIDNIAHSNFNILPFLDFYCWLFG